MNYQGFGVSYIGQKGDQLNGFHYRLTRLVTAFDSKRYNAPKPVFEISRCQFVRRMILQTRISNPLYFSMILEISGNLDCIVTMSLHAEREGLYPLKI